MVFSYRTSVSKPYTLFQGRYVTFVSLANRQFLGISVAEYIYTALIFRDTCTFVNRVACLFNKQVNLV